MKIHVHGCGDKLGNELIEATEFYVRELIAPHLVDGVKFIRIDVAPRTRYWGWCNVIKRDPTRFRIVLASNISKDSQIEVLAHECVHLKQFFLGELWDVRPPLTPTDQQITRWRYRNHYLKKWKYEDHPWEHEANDLAPKLKAKYTRRRGG